MFARVGRSRPHRPVEPSRLLARWRADEHGVTAIEFGMVAMPFLMLLFGIIVVGLFFFTTFSLEHAAEDAGRLIRTGQAQQSGMTADQFKQQVCTRLPGYMDCLGKLRVQVQNFAGFGNIVTPTCIETGGTLIDSSKTPFSPGAADSIVLVTVCYEWELAGKVPFLSVRNMSNGSALLQASTTFRTESYN